MPINRNAMLSVARKKDKEEWGKERATNKARQTAEIQSANNSYAAMKTQANLKAPAYNSEPISNIPSIEDYVKSKQKVAPAPMTEQEFERRKGANGGTISVRGKAYSNYEDYVDSIENPDYENMVNRYNQAKSDTNKAALNVAKKAVTGTGTEADAQAYMDAKEREKALKRDIEYTGASVREAKNFAERQHQDRKLEKTAEEYGRLDESTIKLLDDVNEAESATDSSAASYFAGAMTGSALGNIDLTDYTHSEAYAKLSEMGYNKEQIDALRRYRSAELNKAKTETRQEIIDELYDSGDDASNRVMGALQNGTMQVAGTVASAAPKLLSPLSLVERYKAWETDTPVDLNSPYNTPANYANELREGVMERHDWNVGKVDMFDMLYGTATSTLDSVVAGMLPGISVPEIGGGVAGKIATKALQGTIGGGLIGVEAAVDTMNDLTEKGASSSEAFTGGLVAGAFEGLFESFSIGEFKALQESGKVGIKNVLVDLAKSAGVNASEEGLTEIANIMYDTLANGDLSDYQAKMNEYIQSGMSEEEAKSQVVKDFAFQVIEAAAGGALQGLLMGGVGEGINYANYGKAGSEISGNQQAGELVEAVQKNFADDDKSKAKSMADKYAERIKEGKKVSDTKLGQLQYEATLESENKAVPEKVKASDVEREITQKLADAGKTTSIAPEVAKIAAKEINGEKLTARETDILDNVTEAQEVVSSLKDNQVEKFFRNKITASQIASIGRSAERESSKSQRIDYTNPEVEVNGKALRVDGGNIKKGDVFRFNGVFKDSDGDNAIKLANGQEMKLSKLTFKDSNSEGARLYQKAANMSTELANIYIDQYDGQLLGDYEKAFDQLTALGKLGTDAQAIANTSAEYNPTRFFDASAVGTILKEGLKSKEFKSGLTNYATNQELISKVGKGTFAIVDRIAKDTGLEIFLFDSLGKRGTSQYNGAFVGENRIMLSLDADGGLLLRTIGHEQTHFLKRYNAKGYQRLADRVVAALEKKGGKVSESLKKFKEQGYKDNEQLEELIADSLFKAYDSDFIRDLAKNDKDVAEALGDNLDEMIASIEAGIQSLGQSGNHKEIEALNDDLETLKDIQQIFHEELKVASAEYQRQRAAGKTDDAGISLSAKDDFSEYNKPITEADIQKLRAIGRKSINEFTDKEIEATQKWAYKYFQQMGPKSPFFRRWFGDWRAYDTNTKVEHVSVSNEKISPSDVSREGAINNDTGWKIKVNSDGIDETSHKRGKWSIDYHSLKSINSMLENAILLDTVVVDKPSKKMGKNATFVHHLYCPIMAEDNNGVAKLYVVEEINETKKFYLNKIEMVSTDSTDSAKALSQNSSVDTINNVSDLFDFVKNNNDKFESDSEQPTKFNPKPVNKEFINSDGTPKIFYHGTPNGTFTEFRDWQYFTPNEDYAGNYLNQGASSNGYKKNANNPKVYAAYLKANNIFDTRKPENKKIFDNEFFGKWGNGSPLSDRGLPDWTDGDDLIEFFEENGYDFDAVVLDEGGTGGYGDKVVDRGLSYVIKDSSQIKSATDNIGTFSGSKDINYSTKDTTDTADKLFTLNREISALRRQIDDIKQSDEYKAATTQGDDDLDTFVKRYGDYLKSSGLGNLSKQLTSKEAEYKKLQEQADKEYADAASAKEAEAIAKSGGDRAEYFRKSAVKEFGYTPYFYDAGYLLPNGKMLNFSGEKGKHFGTRGEDHRGIGIIYEDLQGSDAMTDFMNMGNIRIMAESPGIDISTAADITPQQYSMISKFIRDTAQKQGFFSVDFSDENGRSAGNYTYEDNINPTKIVNDIKYFFENGRTREQSVTSQFYYSTKDADYMKAAEAGDTETAQKMVDEAAKAAGYVRESDYQGTSAFNGKAPSTNGYFETKAERVEAWRNGEFEDTQTLGDYITDGIDVSDLDYLINDSRAYRIADSMRKEAISNLRKAINNKSKTITMYRSVPKNIAEGFFRNGDWISPSRQYAVDNAELHGWGENYNIIENTVSVDDVWWDGNDICEWGFDNGNENLVYKNIKNNVKSADPITYDNNGNIIPLSERFNEQNDDIRYSAKDYTETVKLGMNNTEYKATPRTAQFLKERKNATTVDDYGKKTYFDKLMSLYRQYQEGTANKDNFFKDTIAVFKPTQRPKRSPDYVSHNRYGDVSSEYWYTDRGVIRGSNHWGIGIRSCDWALEGIKYGETSTGSKYYGKADWNDILYQTNWKANSDGKTVDLRSFASEARDAEEMENGTMRFSTKDQATDVQRYYEDVIKENRQLQNILSNLDFDTDTLRSSYSLDSQEVNKLANKILRENYSKDENFSKALNTVFDYMLQGEKTGRLDTDAAVQYLMQACTTMLEKSERIDDEAYEETKSIREYLRKVGVTVPENDWNNLVSEFGDAQSFQRATFGRLKVRKGTDFRNDALNGKSGSVKNIDFGNKAEALPVDTLYQELSEEYPGYFDDTIINKYDQVKAIVHFIESTKKKVYQPFGEPVKYTGGLKDFSISARQGEDQMYLEQKAADVAMQLMSEYQKLTRVYTDKQKNELYRREVDEKYRNFKRTFLQNEREKNRQLLSKKKEDVFQWYNTRLSQYKEGRENTEIRRKLNNSIDRAWNYLNTRLEEKSKSKHIPDGFDGLVRDVLKAIPGGVGNDRYAYFNRAALTNLASTYKAKALEVYGTDEKGNASNEDVAELISDFDEFIKSVADDEAPPMRRKDLNMAQVRILNNLISNVKHLVDRQNKLFGEGRQEDINELAQSVLNDYRGKDESIFQRGTEERKAKLLDLADDFRSGLTKPEYLFKESGSKALYDLYKDVRRGENAEGRVIYDAKEFLVNAKAKYNYDPAWETRTVDVPVLNANPVKITQQDAMYIYALSRRKQGRMHLIGDENWNIMGGGIRVTNAVTGKKVNVKLTPQALVHIESQLNDNQRNYVQAVVEYLSKDVAKSRNNTSMEIMGFEKYGETNYIPIRVYKGTLQQNANRPESLGTIANQGASKTLKKKAVNAIDVSGFDDVVSDHIYQSALYCGYATATENFNRVWNNKTDDGERVHGVVEKYLGKNITEYMHNFMVDVNSGQITAKQMALPNRLMGYAKKAATMANISVVVQQPTAVFRAMLYIEPKYFATVASKSDLEEMYKYNGCALKKDIGYFDVNVGRSVTDWLNEYKADDAVKGEWSNAEKWKQFDLGGKIEDLAGWGANKADEITWGAIWNACKKKVAAEQNLSGDALIEKASELFQDTVALTQVYDSVFTKCDYMRRKEGLAQMATAFMSEPITSLNMLMDAKRQIRDAKTDEQKRKARGFTVRAFACFAAATVANAMCKSFIQVLRDDDEEKDFLVKYLTKVVSNIFGDVTGMVPYISDIISMLQGYDPTRLDTQALSKTVSTLQYISKQIKSDDPDYEKIISNGFNMVAQWTGYPVYNVYRDSKAVVDKSTAMIKRLKTKAPQVEFTGHDLARSLEEEFEFLPGVTAKIDYSKYVDDYLAGKIKKVDRVKRDIDDDKITQVTSAIGKKYRAGRISRDDAKRALEALSGKNSEAADSYLKSQDTRMKKESE